MAKRKVKPVVDELPARERPASVDWLMQNFRPKQVPGGFAWTVAPAGSRFASQDEVTGTWAKLAGIRVEPEAYATHEEAMSAMRDGIARVLETLK